MFVSACLRYVSCLLFSNLYNIFLESKALSCTKDDDHQKLVQENLKELCDASRSICDNADDPKVSSRLLLKINIPSCTYIINRTTSSIVYYNVAFASGQCFLGYQ